jgi:hypothetical protein
MLILYLEILLNSLVLRRFLSFLLYIFFDFLHQQSYCLQDREAYFFLSFLNTFASSYLIMVSGTPNAVLNRTDESRHVCFSLIQVGTLPFLLC